MGAEPLTHQLVVNISAGWLRNRPSGDELRSKIILREFTGFNMGFPGGAIPDVLGIWNDTCVNIECKVSRSDFLADRKKDHSRKVGNYRVYACPTGLIKDSEIPKGWGLLYVDRRGGKLITPPEFMENEVPVSSYLCDLLINIDNGGVELSQYRTRPQGIWDGKGVII